MNLRQRVFWFANLLGGAALAIITVMTLAIAAVVGVLL